MKRFNLINVKIPRALFFILYDKVKIVFQINNFFCTTFFNEEFKEYYKEIINEAQLGKRKALNGIKELENNYRNVKLYSNGDEYNNFVFNCFYNQTIREENLNEFYSFIIRNIDYISLLFRYI